VPKIGKRIPAMKSYKFYVQVQESKSLQRLSELIVM